MENELYEICSRLKGYGETRFVVTYAQQNENGSWSLTIHKENADRPQETGYENN